MRLLIFTLLIAGLSTPVMAENLKQIYQQAKKYDATILTSSAHLDANRENIAIARSPLLPQLSLNATTSHIDSDSFNNYRQNQAQLNLSQSIFNRSTQKGYTKAKQGVAIQESLYQQEEDALISRVVQRYFAVLSAQDTLRFRYAETRAIARQLDQARQRYDVGLIPITDVHEAKAAYDQAHSDEIEARNELDDAKQALAEIIGRDPGKLSKLKSRISMKAPAQKVEYWVNRAMENSPAIKAAEQAVDSAQTEVDIQKAGKYPTLSLKGQISEIDRFDSSRLQTENDNSSISLELNWPLFSGGKTYASTRQARANLRASRYELEGIRREVTTSVKNAYRAIKTSISQVNALGSAVKSARSALNATEAGYDVGNRTLVDVLNAQRDLYSARSNYSQARYGYVLSDISLRQSAGTLSDNDINRINKHLR